MKLPVLLEIYRLKSKKEMPSKNCFILVNKNGNMITTDHKLPIYWNKKVALNDKEKFKAHEVLSVKIDYIKNLFQKSATSHYLKNNAKKILKERKKYYYDIYYDRGGGDVFMQTIRENTYKKAKKTLLDIHKGMSIKISHYERTTAQ